MYTVIFSLQAQQDLQALKKSEPQAYKKARLLIEELAEHPKTGRGKPTLKKYDLEGLFARKITDKHRLVYAIDNETVRVDIVSAKGHYEDK